MFKLNLGSDSSSYAYHCDKPGTQQQNGRGYRNRRDPNFNDQVIKVTVATTRQVFPGNDMASYRIIWLLFYRWIFFVLVYCVTWKLFQRVEALRIIACNNSFLLSVLFFLERSFVFGACNSSFFINSLSICMYARKCLRFAYILFWALFLSRRLFVWAIIFSLRAFCYYTQYSYLYLIFYFCYYKISRYFSDIFYNYNNNNNL